jgi:cytidine deaminase
MVVNAETADEMIRAALDARDRAYAPYSGFAVGAAALTSSGRVFSGCNVENASYGLAVCAERTAIASAIAAGEREILALAVVTATSPPATPCGACRQVMAEFGRFPVFLANPAGERRETTTDALLPDAFGPADLEDRP